MTAKTETTKSKNRGLPKHSPFEAATIGEIVPVGTIRKYADGSMGRVTENGIVWIDKAAGEKKSSSARSKKNGAKK